MRYQFVVGHGQEEALRRIVRRISQRRCPSFLAVLKRFGDGDPGWLSFPMPGWTLALDLPAALPGLARFLDGLDDEVAAAGGRVCLAKDSRLRPGTMAAMYPRLPEFRRYARNWTRTVRSARTSPAASRSEPVPRPPHFAFPRLSPTRGPPPPLGVFS